MMLKVVGASWSRTRLSSLLIASVFILGLATIYLSQLHRDVYDGRYAATVFWSEKSGFRIEFWGQGNDPALIRRGVARAYYQPEILTIGWAVLEIETEGVYPDWVQAHAAGLLEGSLTWQLVHWHWLNTVDDTCDEDEDQHQHFCQTVSDLLDDNADAVRATARLMDRDDPFWHQVSLFYNQLDGLEVGWKYAVKRSRQEDNADIPHTDFLWLNAMNDMKDLEMKMNVSREQHPSHPPNSLALLKVTPSKGSGFVLAHATSGFYSSMLKMQKRYKFGFHETGSPGSPQVKGAVVTFTSYPGSLHSQDDFYQVATTNDPDTPTVVAGTPLKNYNTTLWEQVDPINQVLVGARVLAGLRLSGGTGLEWAEHLSRNSSGTGNKQWLVVKGKVGGGEQIDAWLVEQLPGVTRAERITDQLNGTMHFVSQGWPYFREVALQGGYPEEEAEVVATGHVLLSQGQQNVTNLETMVQMMRSPDLSLFSRGDLLDFTSTLTNVSVRRNDSWTPAQVKATSMGIGLHRTHSHQPATKATFAFKGIIKRVMALKRRIKLEQQRLLTATFNSNSDAEESGSDESGSENSDESSGENVQSEEDRLPERVIARERGVKALKGGGGHRLDMVGLIDFKVTEGRATFYAQAGPLHSRSAVQPFRWSESPINNLPHNGQSDLWQFEPVRAPFVWHHTAKSAKHHRTRNRTRNNH